MSHFVSKDLLETELHFQCKLKLARLRSQTYNMKMLMFKHAFFMCNFSLFLCLQGPIALTFWKTALIPASIYMFKVNNRNNRTKCKTCSELTINTPEQPHCHYSGVFIILGSLLSILF